MKIFFFLKMLFIKNYLCHFTDKSILKFINLCTLLSPILSGKKRRIIYRKLSLGSKHYAHITLNSC